MLKKASNFEEDPEFLGALRARQEPAYRDLILYFSDPLYRAIFRILNREEESREVLQDVFVKVIEKIHTFQGDSKLGTWLYRIAVNEALMKVRSRKKESSLVLEKIGPHFEDGVMVENIPDWSGISDQLLIAKENQDFFQQCIEELPSDYKTAYILKDIEQLSEDEVVSILGISKSTMKIRVHRARLFLRRKIEEKYVNRHQN